MDDRLAERFVGLYTRCLRDTAEGVLGEKVMGGLWVVGLGVSGCLPGCDVAAPGLCIDV